MSIFNNLSCSMKKLFGNKNRSHIECDKAIRDHKSQKEIDKTLKDSFPASDPPSTY